jgi:predicted RNase H-like nuclease (RuvC/YqgF family)
MTRSELESLARSRYDLLWDAQRERDALAAAVKALVSEKDAGTFYSVQRQAQVCTYCREENREVVGYVDIPHAPDCPIAVARKALDTTHPDVERMKQSDAMLAPIRILTEAERDRQELLAYVERIEAERDTLAAALKPFALMAIEALKSNDGAGDSYKWEQVNHAVVTVGDLRRAAALDSGGEGA